MNNAKILLVEDNFSCLVRLEMMLDSLGFRHTRTVENGRDALKAIEQQQPDLILMDIELKGNMTGIDIAKKIQHLNIPIIFITAFVEAHYFDEAKETFPYAYLNKPYDEITLERAIKLALAFSSKNNTTTKQEKDDNSIFIKKTGILEKLNYLDILWIKSEGNYCTLFTDKKKYVLKTSLTKLKEKLPKDKFIQCHRSILVQVEKVSQINLKTKKIFVAQNALDIGRSFRKGIIERLGNSL